MLTIEQMTTATKFFHLRFSKKVYRQFAKELNNSEISLKISPTPSEIGINQITETLFKSIKLIYKGTILEDDEAIKYVYLNGNCHYFTTLICNVYKKLGAKVLNASDANDNLPLLSKIKKTSSQKQEFENQLYVCGIGWKETNSMWSEKQKYTFHQIIKLNGKYFDICGGKTKKDFNKHLKEHFETDEIQFKYDCGKADDVFNNYITKIAQPSKSLEPEKIL